MMNSLLKSIRSVRSGEGIIKESLRSNLIISVKEVQLEYSQVSQGNNEQGKNDASSSFCIVLEAVFLHGLKETFADKMASALADPDQRPEPSFWSPLLVFSHRQIIDQIGELSLVTTDVGRCRAWLRLALNECLLSSYLHSMVLQNDALNPYYKPSAYLRDNDLLDVTKQLVKGIEACEFQFACNSSLLNTWTNPPLLMAGLWTPPMKSLPISSGTDVARTMDVSEESAKVDDIVSVASFASYQDSLPSSSHSVLFDEEEALKIILGKNANEPISNTQSDQEENNENVLGKDVEENKEKDNDRLCDRNNLDSMQSSSPEILNAVLEDSNVIFVEHRGIKSSESNSPKEQKTLQNFPKIQSYHSLVECYNQSSTAGNKTPDLNHFMQRFQTSTSSTVSEPSLDDKKQVAEDVEHEFEVIENSAVAGLKVSEFNDIVCQLGNLPLELGLDSQNYTCKTCSQNIGLNFKSIARVCGLTGAYYCEECFGPPEEWTIPARIVHNWDFRRHPVCCQAAHFLNQIQYHPLININLINPRIYLAIEEISQLQDLRIRLNLLRGYLQLCREPIIEELQKRMWPREYLYEHVHLYSIADLIDIPSGALTQQLKSAINFAHKHVTSCWLCSQKGFICEVCNNSKVIYPFDIESTYRCNVCHSVFHLSCLNAFKPCPKCKRRSQRSQCLQSEEIS